jgi:Mn-containing catalase
MNFSEAVVETLEDSEHERQREESARLLKTLLTGPQGKLSMAMQYMAQVDNPNLPEEFRQTLLVAGNEELDHVGLLANMISRLRRGGPAGKAVAHPCMSSRPEGATPAGAFMRAEETSGNLLDDFRRNLEAETQSRSNVLKLLPKVTNEAAQNLLHYIASRDAFHQNIWFDAIAHLQSAQRMKAPAAVQGRVAPWESLLRALSSWPNPLRYLRRA